MEFKCVCGKGCSSQPGLTLHQKTCEDAIQAKQNGKPTVLADDDNPITFHESIAEIVGLVNEMAPDADRCLREKNKSAGKRARTALNMLRKKCTPLRQMLLQTMKDG